MPTHRENSSLLVANRLREDIRTGRIDLGSALPTRRILAEDLGTNLATLQKGIDRLVAQGWLTGHGWHRTTACLHPPDRHRHLLVVPRTAVASTLGESRYYSAFARVVADTARWAPQTWSIHLIDVEREDDLERQAVIETITDRSCVGVHLLHALSFTGDPLLKAIHRAEVPCTIASSSAKKLPFPQVSGVAPVQHRHAIEQCAQIGMRRPAVLGLPGISEGQTLTALAAVAAKAHLEWHTGLLMGFDAQHGHWIGNWLTTLGHLPAAMRPDGLLVLDDHLVMAVATLATQQPWLEGLPIVSCANLPLAPGWPTGVWAVGVDAGKTLAMAMETHRNWPTASQHSQVVPVEVVRG